MSDEEDHETWTDHLSKEEYWEAVEYLKGLDEVIAVEDSNGQTPEIWVYTPYCDANVVGDVLDDLGYSIFSFQHIEYEGQECFLICLDFIWGVPSKVPEGHRLEDRNNYSETEWIDEESHIDNIKGKNG